MQQRKRVILSTLAGGLLFTACGGAELAVQVMTEGAEGMQAESDLPVSFLPFDRDSVFEALAAIAPEPEPQVPADLQQAYDSVLVLQEAWRTAEASWSEVRDSLRQLSDRLQGMDQRSRSYRELYDRFGALEGREQRLNRVRSQAFDAFTALQEMTTTRLDSVRAVRESWEDIAFADYLAIVDSIQDALGRQILEDTTDASGTVFRRLSGGPWWVHTRVAIPAGELYWNVLVEEADTLRLTPANAEQRLRF
jgi:hypothetical protein